MATVDVLILTRIGENFGLGHFKRSKVLEKFLNDNSINTKVLNILDIDDSIISNSGVIMFDAREVDEYFVNHLLSKNKKLISLDDSETYKPYLVSVMSLPYVRIYGPSPNFEGYDYLILDPALGEIDSKSDELELVVTFGGEDPRGLTLVFLEKFSKVFEGNNSGVIIGELFRNKEVIRDICSSRGIKVFEGVPLYEIIASSRVVVTSFGMTLYESLVLGKSVILFNSSRYHHDLFKCSGLEEKYNVFEVGFCEGPGVVITGDLNDMSFSDMKKGRFEVNVFSNLNRWKMIFERVIDLRIQVKEMSGSKVTKRFPNKTDFLVQGRDISICF
ncbi:MAG: hypothetical protein ACK4F9_05765 [Brevinematia bacterium]